MAASSLVNQSIAITWGHIPSLPSAMSSLSDCLAESCRDLESRLLVRPARWPPSFVSRCMAKRSGSAGPAVISSQISHQTDLSYSTKQFRRLQLCENFAPTVTEMLVLMSYPDVTCHNAAMPLSTIYPQHSKQLQDRHFSGYSQHKYLHTIVAVLCHE